MCTIDKTAFVKQDYTSMETQLFCKQEEVTVWSPSSVRTKMEVLWIIVLFMAMVISEFLLELFLLASSTILHLHCLLSLPSHFIVFFPLYDVVARSIWLKHSSLTSQSFLLKIF